jgi:hypothetical protein
VLEGCLSVGCDCLDRKRRFPEDDSGECGAKSGVSILYVSDCTQRRMQRFVCKACEWAGGLGEQERRGWATVKRYHGAGVDLYNWRKCVWRVISAEGGASCGLYVCRVVWGVVVDGAPREATSTASRSFRNDGDVARASLELKRHESNALTTKKQADSRPWIPSQEKVAHIYY